MSRFKGFGTLFGIELKLNVRDMNMVVFAIAMPLVVLAVLGIVYGTDPRSRAPATRSSSSRSARWPPSPSARRARWACRWPWRTIASGRCSSA